MLDINLLRNDPEKVRENIRKKFQDEKLPMVDEVIRMDKEYREAIQQGDNLRNKRKTMSKEIGGLLGKGLKEEAEKVKAEVNAMAEELRPEVKRDYERVGSSLKSWENSIADLRSMIDDKEWEQANIDGLCSAFELDTAERTKYFGPITTDYYGRQVPKHAHGTANLEKPTSSSKIILRAVRDLFAKIVNPNLLVRRINVTVNHVISEEEASMVKPIEQLDLFTDYGEKAQQEEEQAEDLAKERKVQEALLGIKEKFGKNAILKGLNFEEGATAKERNQQIGGHKA